MTGHKSCSVNLQFKTNYLVAHLSDFPLWRNSEYSQCILHSTCILLIARCSRSIIQRVYSTAKLKKNTPSSTCGRSTYNAIDHSLQFVCSRNVFYQISLALLSVKHDNQLAEIYNSRATHLPVSFDRHKQVD